jgi:hypothetical protein
VFGGRELHTDLASKCGRQSSSYFSLLPLSERQLVRKLHSLTGLGHHHHYLNHLEHLEFSLFNDVMHERHLGLFYHHVYYWIVSKIYRSRGHTCLSTCHTKCDREAKKHKLLGGPRGHSE